jgi:hypothetical protein
LEVQHPDEKSPKTSIITYTTLAIGLSSKNFDDYKFLYVKDLTSSLAGDKVPLKGGLNIII